MRRRDLIAMLGGAAVAWPRVARAQQRAMPVIGLCHDGGRAGFAPGLKGFLAGLQDEGFVEGQTVAIEYRFAEGRYDRIPALAADLVDRKPIAIYAPGVTAAAVKAATATIPIVFSVATDPVSIGLVQSLNRPEGNVTGVYFLAVASTAKQLELLHRLIPAAGTIGLLVNPDDPQSVPEKRTAQAAAVSLGLRLEIVNARNSGDLDAAFAALVERRVGALFIPVDPFITGERNRVAGLAARNVIPAMSIDPGFVAAGGLASYDASFASVAHQAGVYVGRILKGAEPADLPVVQSQKFDLAINLKTAKALGVEIPPTVLAIADEVVD